jgi:hypothetical protein
MVRVKATAGAPVTTLSRQKEEFATRSKSVRTERATMYQYGLYSNCGQDQDYSP